MGPSGAAGMRIRELRYRDLPGVARIEQDVFRTPWRKREFAFEIAKPAGVCLAAVEDDHLSGYLVSCRQGPLWSLRNVAVAPVRHRCGLASALLGAMFEAEAVARSHVVLEVRASDSGAIALYERFGFSIVGRRPGFYGDNREDALLMWCSLPL